MRDQFGRNIDYMRISVTDRCNLRCRYCMPDDIRILSMADILSYEEITEICRIAADLGICRVKLTGGEPLVRRQVESLVGMIKAVPGIDTVTMTTNGILLAEKAGILKENGLDAVNVSLDTLDPEKFAEITGRDELNRVLGGIDAALAAGIPVKLNAVHREQLTDEMICRLTEYAQAKNVILRFIEMMPIGAARSQTTQSNERILKLLEDRYGKSEMDSAIYGNGPAVYYRFAGLDSPVGLISAMHGKFCGSCNRIRMSATGQIKPCLCYEATTDLRALLRSGKPDLVREELIRAISEKPRAHCFETPENMTEEQRMAAIGG